jgi:hypothetical protein
MLLNPDDAPAGFYSQAGATAYLIDPAGAYSPAGASSATNNPPGTDGGARPSVPTLAAAGASFPMPGATPAAAWVVDPVAGSPAAATKPTTDPAGTDGGARGRAPTLAVAGVTIPVTGATPAAAEIVDAAGAYSLAGARAPTTDQAGRHSAVGDSVPMPAAGRVADLRRRGGRPGDRNISARRQRADASGSGRAHSSRRSVIRRGNNCLPARHIPPSGRDRAGRRPRGHVQRRRGHRAVDRSGRDIYQSIRIKSPHHRNWTKYARPPQFSRLAAP